MEKKELLNFLDRILIPNGFKRKGNNWVINGEEACKIINLQKSQYGNVYYLNYDYIITSLPLNGWKTHVNHRLGSKEKDVQNRITELLNLENDIEPIDRFSELGRLINEKIVSEMQSVSTEEDILRVLKTREHLYTIPPFVLEYFNLKIEW
jgi:hypothetical protein